MDENQLLTRYGREGDEAAFAELVRRHGEWVYCAARRELADEQLAEDVSQAVFMMLARKAKRLAGHPRLGGWLFGALRYCAREAKRQMVRQRRREQEVARMRPEVVEAASEWEAIAPVLDGSVAALSKGDREVVLLRFYEQRPLAEVGRVLGISEEAARKRVGRAVGKLRGLLAKKGVRGTTAGLSAVLVGNVVGQMPEHLVEKIVAAVGSGGGSTVVAGIAKGAMKMMAMAKVKVVAVVVGIVLAGGAIYAASPATAPAVAANSSEVKNALPTKVTSAQAGQSGFGATLPNGLRLEVVGVSYSPSEGKPWWRPDGSPLPDRPYKSMPNAFVSGGVANRDVAVRIANQPADPVTVKWRVEHQGGASGTLLGARSPDIQGIAVSWPYEAKTTAVTFHAATGPWRTVHVNRSAGLFGTSATSDASGASFIIHRPAEIYGQTQVTVVDNQGDFDVRIVAIDGQGRQHVAQTSSSSAGTMRLNIASFSDIAPLEITELQIQTRPFDSTVQVNNISLNPGETAQVKVEVKLPAPTATAANTTQPAVSVEQLLGETISALDATTTILKSVTDEATARAAVPKLEANLATVLQCHTAVQNTSPLSAETQRSVADRYAPVILKSMGTLNSEIDRIRQDQAVYAILRDSLLKLQHVIGGT